ncbi:hypothetical protein QQF64_030805 [Cirrhinus molitorella]|uniref:Ig-like domain-containing protein n=1 Tax=Cirrhinus molitorella TaxID=172907 RepID=A0ABR3N4D4_9TELE
MIPSVVQPNVSITAPVGGSVSLECHTTADPVVAWFWLKQIPGQELNPIASTYYKEIKLKEEFLNESRFNFNVDDKKSALIFTKITPRDAAFYHCGVLLYEKLYFGGGTYLTVNDGKPVEVIQHPVLDSHHVGDSVTLHCSIFGESCSGGQSVYWLRYKPSESNSGSIYADGDKKDQCKKISMTGSTVQSCVHKVPKSLVSDETYYCSVVTCGKLFIGNGTKLIANGTYYCAAAFANVINFSNGTVLLVKGADLKPADIQQSVLGVMKPGNNVTLQCSVEAKKCEKGVQLVYWYRRSLDTIQPGMVYAQGDMNNECGNNSAASSSTQSCLYNLPKMNVSLSDAGLYYCAVVTCDEVLFGKGTMLIIKDEFNSERMQYFILIGLAVLCTVSFTINMLFCISLKRKDRTPQQFLTTNDDTARVQYRNTDDINYAALNFSTKRGQRKRTLEETTYSVPKLRDKI